MDSLRFSNYPVVVTVAEKKSQLRFVEDYFLSRDVRYCVVGVNEDDVDSADPTVVVFRKLTQEDELDSVFMKYVYDSAIRSNEEEPIKILYEQ